MYCPKCGKENPDNAQLCHSCSSVLTSTPTQAPSPDAKTSGLAITSLVLAILSPFTCLITAVPAIILGIVGLVKIGKSAGQLKGKGLAIAGIVVPTVSGLFLLLIATLVVTKVQTQIAQAHVITTKANLRHLHSSVYQFKMDTGRFPTEEEGLTALIERPSDVENWEPGGYLESTEVPKDGWGNDFIYELYPDPASGKPFVIKSLGADGVEGGEEYDADLLGTDPY